MLTIQIQGDGSHHGLGDFYPRVREQLAEQLHKGPQHSWQTEWFGSKKEIASGRIGCVDGKIHLEASCSDDFDTEGYAEKTIDFTTDIDLISEHMDSLLDAAQSNREDNEPYAGFRVGREGRWEQTYLVDKNGEYLDGPPGDNYHRWGWADIEEDFPPEMSEDTANRLAEWAEAHAAGITEAPSLTVNGWTIAPWNG